MNYAAKFGNDQLTNQKDLLVNFLTLFEEGIIAFPPTYKIGKDLNI